jgi:spore maturation protein CgeB
MRVLVVGEAYPDSFADNLHSTLRDAGHDVCAVSPFPRWLARHGRARARLRGALPVAPRAALRLQRPVVDAAESFRPDVVLNVDARLSHLVVGELRSVTAAPIAFWFPDSPGGLGRETHLLAGYDAVLLKDTVVVRRYRRVLGVNAHFVPEACNPRWHRPFDDAAPGAAGETVLVAGNMYATRYLTVRRLVEAGLNVEVSVRRGPRGFPATVPYARPTPAATSRGRRRRAPSAAPGSSSTRSPATRPTG